MRFTNTLITLIALLFLQCKANNVTQDSGNSDNVPEAIPIVLLLEDGISPMDLDPIEALQIESTKRTSRSQNMWLVKIKEDVNKVENLLLRLKEDQRVMKVSFDQKSKGSSTFKNTKSGTSDPIKN